MARKKNKPEEVQSIDMVKVGRSVKHGFFPDTYPGGYESFDSGDRFTVQHLPKDGVCDGTTIIRRYRVTTDHLLQDEGYGLRPMPEDLAKFLKKYPSDRRKNDVLHLLPGRDIKALPKIVDYSKYSKEELLAIATNPDTDDITFLDADNELRRRANGGKNV